MVAHSWPIVENPPPAAPDAVQKDPAPWVGNRTVPGSSCASRRTEVNWWAVSRSVSAAPARSVRPAEPASSEPPLNSSDRPSSPAQEVAGVVQRVAGRVQRLDPKVARLDGLAVVRRVMAIPGTAAGRQHERRPGASCQLEPAGDVVVVHVRLEDVGQPRAMLLSRHEVGLDIALRVDHDGVIARDHQVRPIAQAGRQEVDDARVSRTDARGRGHEEVSGHEMTSALPVAGYVAGRSIGRCGRGMSASVRNLPAG